MVSLLGYTAVVNVAPLTDFARKLIDIARNKLVWIK